MPLFEAAMSVCSRNPYGNDQSCRSIAEGLLCRSYSSLDRIGSTTARIGINLGKSPGARWYIRRSGHFTRHGRTAMRRLCCRSLVAIAGLMATGCVQQKPVADPTSAAAQLSSGAPLLRCRTDCVGGWRAAQPHAAQLEAAARWQELAALVIAINYQDDLTLYYLARAAEGLGYPAAADSYYRQSTSISGSSLSCRHASGVCGGVALPDAALARIAALESQARPSPFQPRRQPATAAKPPLGGSKPIPAAEPKPQAPSPRKSGSHPGRRSRSRGNPRPRSSSRTAQPSRLPSRTGPRPRQPSRHHPSRAAWTRSRRNISNRRRAAERFISPAIPGAGRWVPENLGPVGRAVSRMAQIRRQDGSGAGSHPTVPKAGDLPAEQG